MKHLSYWIYFSLNRAVLLLFTLLLLSASTLSEASDKGIYQKPKSADYGLEEVTLIIGVPLDYEERGIQLPDRNECEPNGSQAELCSVFRYGNEYQLLDWIENAQIDGAYLSSVSLQLMEGFSENEFKDHFYVFSAEDEQGYHTVLSAHQGEVLLSDPMGRYKSYLNDLKSGANSQRALLNFRSHLDPSFLSLYKVTQQWVDKNIKKNSDRENLWLSLIDNLQFGESGFSFPSQSNDQIIFSGGITQNCDDQSSRFCFETDKPEHNFLLVRKQAFSEVKSPSLFGLKNFRTVREKIDFKKLCSDEHGTERGLEHVCQFIVDNYKHYKYGANIKRYFRFPL